MTEKQKIMKSERLNLKRYAGKENETNEWMFDGRKNEDENFVHRNRKIKIEYQMSV